MAEVFNQNSARGTVDYSKINELTEFFYYNAYPGDPDKAARIQSKVRFDLKPFSEYIGNSIKNLDNASKVKAECIEVRHRLVLSPQDALLRIKASESVRVKVPEDNYYFFEWDDEWGSYESFDALLKGRQVVLESPDVIDVYNGVLVFKTQSPLDTSISYKLYTKGNDEDYRCSIAKLDYSKLDTYRIESGNAKFASAYIDGNFTVYQHSGMLGKSVRFFGKIDAEISGSTAISVEKSEIKMENDIAVEVWRYVENIVIAHCDDEDVKKLYVNNSEVAYDVLSKEELCSILNDKRIAYIDKKIEIIDRTLGNTEEPIIIKGIKFIAKDPLNKLGYKFRDKGVYVELQEDEQFKDDIYSNISHFFKETTEFVRDENDNRYKIGYGSEKFSQIEIALVDKKGQLLPRMTEVPTALYVEPNTRQLRMQQNALNILLKKPCKEHAPLLELMQDKKFARWERVLYQSEEINEWYRLTDPNYEGCESQREFVKKALATPDFAILEGPPGSGKTTTILEIIAQMISRGKRVMLAASTNAAVDNILERLEDLPPKIKKQILAVRIGNDNAISESVEQYKVSKIADEEIKNEIVRRANLVCGTIIGVLQHPEFKLEKRDQQAIPLYDCLIVDEASKTTFQEFLVPAIYAKKWILSGDLRQLTPYIEQDSIESSLKQIPSYKEADQRAQSILMTLENYVYSKKENTQYKFVISIDSETMKSLPKVLADYPQRNIVLVGDKINANCALTASEFLDGNIKACMVYGADIVFCDSKDFSKIEAFIPAHFIPLLNNRKSILTFHNDGCFSRFQGMKFLGSDATKLDDAKNAIDKELREKSWASEIAWRLCRIQELFLLSEIGDESNKREKYRNDINKRIPKFAEGDINRTISLLTEIALPSIIQLLQKGVSDRTIVASRNETTLNGGFREYDLRDRHTLVEYQHRMHSDISAFSAKHIYEGRALKNGNRINRDWGYYEYPKRACWLNVAGKSNCNNNNQEEVKVIITEVNKFISFAKDHPKHNGEPWTIACLTYYRKQEEMLKKELHRILKTERASSYQNTADGAVEIMIYTVDKFQGKEADIVFLSMIKSGQAGLGFMDSPNRLNVALTRAKYQMVVVGDKEFFRSNRCKSELLRSVAEEY